MSLNLELLKRVDISNTSYFQGDFKFFRADNKFDYETFIFLALPFNRTDFKEGNFTLDYKGNKIEVNISKITDKDQDPIFSFINKVPSAVVFGPERTGLPPEMYTDNKGEYPYYCAIIHFPFCLAYWFDPSTPSGSDYSHH